MRNLARRAVRAAVSFSSWLARNPSANTRSLHSLHLFLHTINMSACFMQFAL